MRQYKHTVHGKHRYADGGTVNPTQKALGPTVFQSRERKQREAMQDGPEPAASAPAPSTGGFFNGRPKPDAAKNAAKLQQLLKKRDAEVE